MVLRGAVLVGGFSPDMGVVTGLLDWDGEPLVIRLARALMRAEISPTIVAAKDVVVPLPCPFPWVTDSWPGRGPLGGVATALATGHAGPVLVVPSDRPFLSPTFFRFLRDSARPRGFLPTYKGVSYPTLALYPPEARKTAERYAREVAPTIASFAEALDLPPLALERSPYDERTLDRMLTRVETRDDWEKVLRLAGKTPPPTDGGAQYHFLR